MDSPTNSINDGSGSGHDLSDYVDLGESVTLIVESIDNGNCPDCGGDLFDTDRNVMCRECGVTWKRHPVEFEYDRMVDE